jgi:hypothetical protein
MNRKLLALSFVLVLVVASLSGCAMGATMAPPDREITVSVDDALAAQDAGMAGLMIGQVEMSESQFSSFLSVLLQQNTGPNNPITGIHAWFEPDNQIYLRVALADGVLLGSNTVDLVGKVMVADNHLMVDLQEAAANGYSVSGAMLAPVNAYINGALSDPSMGVAVDVSTSEGMITIGLTQ